MRAASTVGWWPRSGSSHRPPKPAPNHDVKDDVHASAPPACSIISAGRHPPQPERRRRQRHSPTRGLPCIPHIMLPRRCSPRSCAPFSSTTNLPKGDRKVLARAASPNFARQSAGARCSAAASSPPARQAQERPPPPWPTHPRPNTQKKAVVQRIGDGFRVFPARPWPGNHYGFRCWSQGPVLCLGDQRGIDLVADDPVKDDELRC